MSSFSPEAPLANGYLTTTQGAGRLPDSPVPRWARIAAHAVPYTILPSGLWRLGVMLAIPGFGTVEARDHGAGLDLYLVLLFVVSEGLGLLTLGLVQPWGEWVPRWIPLLGGRRVPPLATLVPAALGTLATTGVVYYFFLHILFAGFPPGHTTTEQVVLTACYLPLLAWGPLLGSVTYAYYRRRASGQRSGQLGGAGSAVCSAGRCVGGSGLAEQSVGHGARPGE
ncbi:hypothetical protein [Streptomyces sp. NBC_00083]|uniref:hypothetical protein n=1 Tax=Streptomyces sp. NBC_00083 TaxID=2975647 RepID=UPI00225A9769|nr:hypothetical protein [Streptomyces sp. NBC_00083]MCX5384718.1 hypothetical protein [Streptomyces sp. NBC_00083]